MAQKMTQAEPVRRTENMEFEVTTADGPVLLRFKDVPVTDVSFERLVETLVEGGIHVMDAERYAGEFMEMVATGEMAKFLAQRSKRIG